MAAKNACKSTLYGMLSRRAGLSATAGLSCYLMLLWLIND